MMKNAGAAAKLAAKGMGAIRDELVLSQVPMMTELSSFSGGKIRTEHKATVEIKLTGNAVKHLERADKKQLVKTQTSKLKLNSLGIRLSFVKRFAKDKKWSLFGSFLHNSL